MLCYCFFPKDIDRNKDGLISLDEFLGDYHDPDDKEAEEPEWVKEETKKFNEEYDKNHDGKLDKDEASFTLALLFTEGEELNCFLSSPTHIDTNIPWYFHLR